jgi:hypothetical protein
MYKQLFGVTNAKCWFLSHTAMPQMGVPPANNAHALCANPRKMFASCNPAHLNTAKAL